MKESLEFTLNGNPTRLEVDPKRKLLWVLRGELGLTGSKFGCGEGHCGACTVLVGRQAVRSCLVPVRAVAGKEVKTIEGLENNGELHPLQKAFVEHDALQCGYCTPGMIMNAYGLLLETPQPTRQQIIDRMEGNLCRCAVHNRIVAAIQTAARQMQGGQR